MEAKNMAMRKIGWYGATGLLAGLMASLPVQAMMVYGNTFSPVAATSTVHSNAVMDVQGSDQDVTAYDNFTLNKAAAITGVAWRGTSSDKAMGGFTIRLYASRNDAAAQPDTGQKLAELIVEGNAGEKSVGKNLSDYHANFSQPVALQAGVQYWISIVSERKNLSPWGWANGTGGDGKSIQAYSEFKVLPAPGDRAFYLMDGRAHTRKR
jgi:hypothetical protein